MLSIINYDWYANQFTANQSPLVSKWCWAGIDSLIVHSPICLFIVVRHSFRKLSLHFGHNVVYNQQRRWWWLVTNQKGVDTASLVTTSIDLLLLVAMRIKVWQHPVAQYNICFPQRVVDQTERQINDWQYYSARMGRWATALQYLWQISESPNLSYRVNEVGKQVRN